jgi:hypothetical protein
MNRGGDVLIATGASAPFFEITHPCVAYASKRELAIASTKPCGLFVNGTLTTLISSTNRSDDDPDILPRTGTLTTLISFHEQGR